MRALLGMASPDAWQPWILLLLLIITSVSLSDSLSLSLSLSHLLILPQTLPLNSWAPWASDSSFVKQEWHRQPHHGITSVKDSAGQLVLILLPPLPLLLPHPLPPLVRAESHLLPLFSLGTPSTAVRTAPLYQLVRGVTSSCTGSWKEDSGVWWGPQGWDKGEKIQVQWNQGQGSPWGFRAGVDLGLRLEGALDLPAPLLTWADRGGGGHGKPPESGHCTWNSYC